MTEYKHQLHKPTYQLILFIYLSTLSYPGTTISPGITMYEAIGDIGNISRYLYSAYNSVPIFNLAYYNFIPKFTCERN